MGSIYIGIIFVCFIATVLLIAVLRLKTVKFYIPIGIYIIVLFFYSLKVTADIKNYQSYNREDFSDVTGISINNVMVDKEQYKMFFEGLKYDKFSWVNHPIKRKEYFINIFTRKKVYKFKVWDTHNQGVLVSRINDDGKEFVTNRNDYILQYLK
ncbi:hypothetical protein EG347_06385 [Chryseobacterium sp. G0186]|uniref:hypothetical protein n=1 Tax=Chryseobacterium sp. G0186 TaxID=2487064 RepID=UPI000F5088B1|nr:hypothetical protein [Chryseobacterium sp. G0186]AZA77156.1 hypothetical protein EG347_06385 [Chryseobacterium sp. G0186]